MSNERLPDVNLQFLYHKYVNKIEREENVRVGFGLFLGGFALAALALLLIVASYVAFEPRTDPFFRWVQGGYSLAMLSLPFAMLGIVVLLPPPKRMFLAVSSAGLLVTLAATIGFLWAYPDNWNFYGNNYTLPIVLIYSVGLAAISVGAGTSLREHAPELVQTVTEIVQQDSEEESDDTSDGTANHVSLGRDEESDDDSDETANHVSLGRNEEEESDESLVTRGKADEEVVTLVINGFSYSFGDGDTFGRREEPWLEDLKMACDGDEEIPYVSSDHVEFTVEEEEVYVEDLSRNGTKLNGDALDGGRAPLSDGDTLVLANRAKITVEIDNHDSPAPF